MKKGKNRFKDVFQMIESRMSPKEIKCSDAKARKTLLQLRLGEYRKRLGIDQTAVRGFRQPDVSKIESRGDIKLSTLIDYCRGLGADVKIVAKKHGKEFVLLEE